MDKIVTKKENIIIDKSKKFAISSIKLYKSLINNKKEFVISQQFLKSATRQAPHYSETGEVVDEYSVILEFFSTKIPISISFCFFFVSS